jgi:hypothetical protein
MPLKKFFFYSFKEIRTEERERMAYHGGLLRKTFDKKNTFLFILERKIKCMKEKG